jgi:hypothetical protein
MIYEFTRKASGGIRALTKKMEVEIKGCGWRERVEGGG